MEDSQRKAELAAKMEASYKTVKRRATNTPPNKRAKTSDGGSAPMSMVVSPPGSRNEVVQPKTAPQASPAPPKPLFKTLPSGMITVDHEALAQKQRPPVIVNASPIPQRSPAMSAMRPSASMPNIYNQPQPVAAATPEVVARDTKTCHQCRQQFPLNATLQCTRLKQRARTSPLIRCTITYCPKCLLNRYDIDATALIARGRRPGDTEGNKHVGEDESLYLFECMVCADQCNCSTCRKKKGLPPLGQLTQGKVKLAEMGRQRSQGVYEPAPVIRVPVGGARAQSTVERIQTIRANLPVASGDVSMEGSEAGDGTPGVSGSAAGSVHGGELAREKLKPGRKKAMFTQPEWKVVDTGGMSDKALWGRLQIREFVLRFQDRLRLPPLHLKNLNQLEMVPATEKALVVGFMKALHDDDNITPDSPLTEDVVMYYLRKAEKVRTNKDPNSTELWEVVRELLDQVVHIDEWSGEWDEEEGVPDEEKMWYLLAMMDLVNATSLIKDECDEAIEETMKAIRADCRAKVHIASAEFQAKKAELMAQRDPLQLIEKPDKETKEKIQALTSAMTALGKENREKQAAAELDAWLVERRVSPRLEPLGKDFGGYTYWCFNQRANDETRGWGCGLYRRKEGEETWWKIESPAKLDQLWRWFEQETAERFPSSTVFATSAPAKAPVPQKTSAERYAELMKQQMMPQMGAMRVVIGAGPGNPATNASSRTAQAGQLVTLPIQHTPKTQEATKGEDVEMTDVRLPADFDEVDGDVNMQNGAREGRDEEGKVELGLTPSDMKDLCAEIKKVAEFVRDTWGEEDPDAEAAAAVEEEQA
ncbi:hypothetical protein YB2330_003065 [Saitoella coloradoensis]